jgi:hypothetical protein
MAARKGIARSVRPQENYGQLASPPDGNFLCSKLLG